MLEHTHTPSRFSFRRAALLSTFATLWILGPAPASAQTALNLQVEAVDARNPEQVLVDASVRDANGLPVADLDADSFTLREDGGAEGRPLLSAEAGSDPARPVALVLALDLSGSMAGQALEDAKAAALAVLAQLGPEDRVAILGFADQVDLDALNDSRETAFSTDKAAVETVVRGLSAGGNTPLYDAVFKAVRLAAAESGVTRAVLLLTDGRDEVRGGARGSGSAVANEDSPLREANRAGVPVFTIGLGEGQDEAWLKRLALETGGSYQSAPSSAELADRFGQVLARLKLRYRLSYRSTAADGGRHMLALRVQHGDAEATDEISFLAGQVGMTPEATDGAAAPPGDAGADPAETPADADADAGVEGESLRWRIAEGLLLAFCLLALLAVALGRRKRRPAPYRCLNCGHALDGPDSPCPNGCGFSGTYKGGS